MRVLGAKFQNRPDAVRALEHVRETFGAAGTRVAPLADGSPTATLLAGVFDERSENDVRSLLVSHGGEIVSDVDERATH